MKTLEELGELCDRTAEKLYDNPPDRDGMLDLATVLSFVSHFVDRHLHLAHARAEWGSWLFAADLGVAAVRQRLGWLQAQASTLPDATIARTVDRILHVLARIIVMLSKRAPEAQRAF